MPHVHAGENYQPLTFSLIVNSYKFFLETQSYIYHNFKISTFPTNVLNNPKYFVPLAHLLLKSPIGTLIGILYECIFYIISVSAYAFARVCAS